MAPDLITLSVIRHEDSTHYTKLLHSPDLKASDSKSPQQLHISEHDLVLSTLVPFIMPTSTSDARTKALVSMYSTGFVFNQNQQRLVKALPWCAPNKSTVAAGSHGSIMSSDDIQKMASRWVAGRGNGRAEVGAKQVEELTCERRRREHASSMFALLT